MILLVIINSIALFGAITWCFYKFEFEPIVAAISLLGTLVLSIKEFVNRYKKSINRINFLDNNKINAKKISFLGFLGSGKTTYLSVLITELEKIVDLDTCFTISDRETNSKIHRYRIHLTGGEFPLSTGAERNSYYEFIISKKKPFFSKRILFEIGDISSDTFEAFLSSCRSNSVKWLHDNQHFTYIIESSAIIFPVDLEKYIDRKNVNVSDKMIYSLLTTINALFKAKSIPENEKIEIPICIIFLKSDLLSANNIDEEEVIESYSDLIQFCSKKCKLFNYFFVSSVGNNFFQNNRINPYNVTEPILWIFETL